MSITQAALALAAGIEDNDRTSLTCDGCHRSYDEPNAEQIKELIEHALFEHVGRAGIIVTKWAPLLGPYELALAAGVDARTEHEEKWRESRAAAELFPGTKAALEGLTILPR